MEADFRPSSQGLHPVSASASTTLPATQPAHLVNKCQTARATALGSLASAKALLRFKSADLGSEHFL